MAAPMSFDVLVVGSGASGLAAAVSANAAGARVRLVTHGSLQSCNSAQAQGVIEASTVQAFPKSPLQELKRAANGWRARCGEHTIEAATVVLAAGGRCFRVAEERGELSTNHPGATGEVTRFAVDLGAETRDFDAL